MDWAKRAKTYDCLDWVREPDYQRAVLDACDLQAWHRVLDVGCGTGQLTRKIAPRVKEAVGLDLSPAMLAYADGQRNIKLLVGDVRDMRAVKSNTFDCVLARMVFHHILEDLDKAVSECHRVLRPGGRLVVAEGVPPDPSLREWFSQMMALKEERVTFLPADLEALLSGFRKVTSSLFIQKGMSLRNWLDFGGVPEEAKAEIWRMHLGLDDTGREHYNMSIVRKKDVLMDWTTCIVVGIK